MHPVETYLRDLHAIRATGAAVSETSYYAPLAELLNAVGRALKPAVRCHLTLANRGAGLPDGGLFTAEQYERRSDAAPLPGQNPARGVLEVKGTGADVRTVAQSAQVQGYLAHYGQVLVTNYRDFLLLGRDAEGHARPLEEYRLAENEAAFWAAPAGALVHGHAARLSDYLQRVMLHAAPLNTPQDVAWFLASYAREARARMGDAAHPALASLRAALEEALGVRFEGPRGEHFFRSTLVQTLFYGVFSAWVLWSESHPGEGERFDWRTAAYHLNVPVIQALFEQISAPSKLRSLDLVAPLDWAGAALARVQRTAFFAAFGQGQAVQYFYEPFLEAFDPELRKDLGVRYTPPEIVRYMVARVDAVLRAELGLEDGLADPRVVVLDACCGTGAYVVETLRCIAATLRARGEDALTAQEVKKAARERVYGFEILPAPFVVAHLQLGLLLQSLGAPLAEGERAGIYLTNALIGWEPPEGPKTHFMFPELAAERDAAAHIKRDAPVLVVLGNPPYNGFAGLAVDEERDLSNAYRTTRRAPAPQGQGLNDLYVRFFRMAERKIVEGTGQGVVCFISNYSWLDGLSFTGMRERYLDVFDRIWVDCLNGDKYKTGKLTPEGAPDPSVFSTEFSSEGIQVGTAIALLVRRQAHAGSVDVRFRHWWGKSKRADLLASATQEGASGYETLDPPLTLGLPFMPAQVGQDYTSWPRLPELLPVSFPGVKTSRDQFLVDIDRQCLEQRVRAYFDPHISDEEIHHLIPSAMQSTGQFEAQSARDYLRKRGFLPDSIVRFAYRPFDTVWVYWEPETNLLDRKREDFFAALHPANLFLTSRQKAERQWEGTPFYVTPHLAEWHLTRPGSACFPLYDYGPTAHKQLGLFGKPEVGRRANLSPLGRTYLAKLGLADPDTDEESAALVWMHALAIGYAPAYLAENADGLRQDWPRIPLPGTLEALRASAALGRQVAALLDTEAPVPGVTTGTVPAELRAVAVISRVDGQPLDPAAGDLAVTAGWGHAGQGGVTMPGKGRLVARAEGGYDVYLNAVAYWRNVPERVWEYTIGGYQVLKKWLSYREQGLLGRALTPEEVRAVTGIGRRLAALVALEPALDANYGASKLTAL